MGSDRSKDTGQELHVQNEVQRDKPKVSGPECWFMSVKSRVSSQSYQIKRGKSKVKSDKQQVKSDK